MEEVKKRLMGLFAELGRVYVDKDITNHVELYVGTADVHIFYRLNSDLDKVVHVRGHTGQSEPTKFYVSAYLKDYQTMLALRQKGKDIGEEDLANDDDEFKDMGKGRILPADANYLEKLLQNDCSLL